jgi:ubiquinone/menaquinone biosynthesis C-methylase UbiE
MISDENYFNSISQTTELKPHKFEFDKSRYNRHSKMYDFVFVSIDLEKVENQKMFFKKLYAVSKNAGKVLFITSLKEDLQTLEEKLIEYNYVAVNSIASTFSNYQILSAQKMHGWGN